MKGPSIFIGTLEIAEFMGTFTDILLAILCFYIATKLSKMSGERGSRKLLLWHFYLLGFSTLIGGIVGHGFFYVFGMQGKIPNWLLSNASVFALELVVLRLVGAQIPKKLYLFAASLSTSLFIACSVLGIWSLKFMWVMAHSAYGLLFIVGGFGIFMIRKNLFTLVFKRFWIAIGFSFVAALVFALKLAPMKWFNHMDLSHVFLGLSFWFFYLGGKELLRSTRES